MKRYNPSNIEPKWQKIWEDKETFKAKDFDPKPKKYVAGQFPYPSAAGLHAGHAKVYAIVDAMARFYRQSGHNVLNPMGWDNFGMPTENYAIKTGKSPQEVTIENVTNFKRQFKRMGVSIDWSREILTSDPEYYRWTQWIFKKLYERGLVYRAENLQWWCPNDKTVLANEQVEDGLCWRCKCQVEKRRMNQWFFKITAYADQLLGDVDSLDWPSGVKEAQKNWIGRSEGAEVEFEVDLGESTPSGISESGSLREKRVRPVATGADDAVREEMTRPSRHKIRVFTTRPDTIFGATFIALAPEHPLALELANDLTRETVAKYIDDSMKKSEIERQENKVKTGVFTGAHAINPASGKKMQIWIADYVLGGYGDGAIMGVPAHDDRDLEFAEKFKLPVVQVIRPCLYGEPRSDSETRRTISVVLQRPSDKKFLLVKNKEYGWISPVIGGIDDGETIATTAEREVLEETGYRAKFVRTLGGETEDHFHAIHKGVWRHRINQPVLMELLDETPTNVCEEECETQEPLWLTLDQAIKQITPPYPAVEFLRFRDGINNYGLEGVLINSGQFDNLSSLEAREKITAWLAGKGIGKKRVQYKMRDWLISRQRYWGAPIPIAYDAAGKVHLIPDDQLPVVLPEISDYHPDDSGRSALARDKDFVNVIIDGQKMTRETDTMDGFACSSWYLLRYADAHNSQAAWDPAKANYWNPVDFYVGGEHSTTHMLYVRFWTMVFKDMGLTNFSEPITKFLKNGQILAEDGRKMSKSLGNTIDPLEIIDQGYGADTLRTFILFMGPPEGDASWSTRGLGGAYRFLNRTWNLIQEYDSRGEPFSEAGTTRPSGPERTPLKNGSSKANQKLKQITSRMVKRVTQDLEENSFNTAIAALMEAVNELYLIKNDGVGGESWREALSALVRCLAPFAPHIACECYEILGFEESIEEAGWPTWNEADLIADKVELVVQVGGKVRGKATVDPKLFDDTKAVEDFALALENVKSFIGDKEVKRVIVISGRHLVNIVI